MFEKPIAEIIRKRRSVRRYQHKPVDEKLKEKVIKGFSRLPPSPFNHTVGFRLIDFPERAKGNVRGAGTYIAGKVMRTPGCWEDYGYLFEQLILLATDLGLSTCWLGLFNRKLFYEKMTCRSYETVPAVSPIGYSDDENDYISRLIRTGVGSRRRKSWEALFFDTTVKHTLTREKAGPFEEPLEMVRLSPSASNRQPWRIICDRGKACHFYLRRTPGYRFVLPVDLQLLDMGIAMAHFELTCSEKKLKGRWHILDAPMPDVPSQFEYRFSWVPS